MGCYTANIMAKIEKPQLPPIKVGSSDYRGTRYYYVQRYTFHYDPATKKCKRDNQKTVGKVKGNERYGLLSGRRSSLKNILNLRTLMYIHSKNGLEFKACDLETNNVINPVKIEKKLAGAT